MRFPKTSIKFCPGVAAKRQFPTDPFETFTRSRLKSEAHSVFNGCHLEFGQVLFCFERPKVIIVTSVNVRPFRFSEILQRTVDNPGVGKEGLQPFENPKNKAEV